MNEILILRLACALLGTFTLFLVYSDVKGLEMRYQDARILLRGVTRWTTFTVWCFTILTLHFWFAVAGLESLATATFAIAHPLSILVTFIVSFVLYPKAEKHGFYVDRMFKFRPQMMHNANVVMMQAEMLVAPWPLEPQHGALVVAFCACYGVFAAWWFRRTGVYYYFFLDYRKKRAWVTYASVLMLIAALYAGSYALSRAVLDGGASVSLVVVTTIATLGILRTRRSGRALRAARQLSDTSRSCTSPSASAPSDIVQ